MGFNDSDMFTALFEHGGGHSTMAKNSLSKERMIARFLEWGIHMKWVTLFPHVDDFNGRDVGLEFPWCGVTNRWKMVTTLTEEESLLGNKDRQ